MRRLLALSIVFAAVGVSSAVMADEKCEPGVICLKPYTVYGRAPKPSVVIELQHPSAATQAGAAHDAMKEEWLKKLEPATLHPSQQH